MVNQFYQFLQACNGLDLFHTDICDKTKKKVFEQNCDEGNDWFYKVSLEMTHFYVWVKFHIWIDNSFNLKDNINASSIQKLQKTIEL